MLTSQKGEWKTITPKFNGLPLHTALLHTGKVLTFGGSGKLFEIQLSKS